MPSFPIVYPAFKSILVNRLQKILSDSKKPDFCTALSCFDQLAEPSMQQEWSAAEIPLKRIQQDRQIEYVSAIAFKLANSTHASVTDIAAQLTARLRTEQTIDRTCSDRPPIPAKIWRSVTVQSTPTGWLHFQIGDMGVVDWLQTIGKWLQQTSPADRPHPVPLKAVSLSQKQSSGMFEVLYAHARCCSLLRLAMQSDLALCNFAMDRQQIAGFECISWHQEGNFRCQHPTEQRLVCQMIDVMDELGNHPAALTTDRVWRLAWRLSQTFQNFHAHCPLLLKTSGDRELAQARLGLVILTQALLQWMLQDWLQIEAPIEL
jgi:arginyl-tRNA synthetase